MNNQLSKLSIGLLGFVAGVAFLISCGGDGTDSSLPINDADAITASQVWSEIVPEGVDSSNQFIVPGAGMIMSDIIASTMLSGDPGALNSSFCDVKLNGTLLYVLSSLNQGHLSVSPGIRLNQNDVITMDCNVIAGSEFYSGFILSGFM